MVRLVRLIDPSLYRDVLIIYVQPISTGGYELDMTGWEWLCDDSVRSMTWYITTLAGSWPITISSYLNVDFHGISWPPSSDNTVFHVVQIYIVVLNPHWLGVGRKHPPPCLWSWITKHRRRYAQPLLHDFWDFDLTRPVKIWRLSVWVILIFVTSLHADFEVELSFRCRVEF